MEENKNINNYCSIVILKIIFCYFMNISLDLFFLIFYVLPGTISLTKMSVEMLSKI